MYVYRIQIDELNNGEKRYRAQKGYLVTTRGWLRKQYIEWDDIFPGSFITEELALSEIEREKKRIAEKRGENVKSTTYKIIE